MKDKEENAGIKITTDKPSIEVACKVILGILNSKADDYTKQVALKQLNHLLVPYTMINGCTFMMGHGEGEK